MLTETRCTLTRSCWKRADYFDIKSRTPQQTPEMTMGRATITIKFKDENDFLDRVHRGRAKQQEMEKAWEAQQQVWAAIFPNKQTLTPHGAFNLSLPKLQIAINNAWRDPIRNTQFIATLIRFEVNCSAKLSLLPTDHRFGPERKTDHNKRSFGRKCVARLPLPARTNAPQHRAKQPTTTRT